MNLSNLFEMQEQLDEHIEKEHPRKENESRLNKKILALLVELGELANEWRGFKFWSKDQEPRTKVPVSLWGEPFKNPLLEEYVDCLHFTLSIGLEIGIDTVQDFELISHFDEGCEVAFLETQLAVTNFYKYKTECNYYEILRCLLILGRELGFTNKQIEQAYLEKNAINHQRQESGY